MMHILEEKQYLKRRGEGREVVRLLHGFAGEHAGGSVVQQFDNRRRRPQHVNNDGHAALQVRWIKMVRQQMHVSDHSTNKLVSD